VLCAPPHKIEKYSSGNYRAKFGKFATFFGKNKNSGIFINITQNSGILLIFKHNFLEKMYCPQS